MGIFDRFSTNSGSNFASRFSPKSINNLVIFISFIVMVYILVQMIIVLNKPEFLYYTLSPMPTDLSNQDFRTLKDSNKLPEMFANEFTYSFWVYLRSVNNNLNQDSIAKNKLVFTRSKNDDDNYFKGANPIVYFKGDTNKLVIKIRTTDVDKVSTPNNIKEPNTLDELNNEQKKVFDEEVCYFSTLEVDYVPLKRWVNIIINVDNNRVTLFVDGDIYKTVLVNRNPDTGNCGANFSTARLVSPTEGTIKLGKSTSDPDKSIYTPDGMISKLQFFNYSLKTPSDIRKIYDNGPIESQSFLQKFGIPNLGLRNPIYNIEDTCN